LGFDHCMVAPESHVYSKVADILKVMRRGCTHISYTYRCLFSLLLLSLIHGDRADAQGMSLSLPLASVDACQEYFTSEWNTPLDMNESDDLLYNLLPREISQLDQFTYADGVASTRARGIDPLFRLLTPVDHERGTLVAIPDDTTRFGVNRPLVGLQAPYYDTLSMRMYTDRNSNLQIMYEKQDGSYSFTEPVSTYVGWHVYDVDLRTAAVQVSQGNSSWESSPVTAMRVDPTSVNGAHIKFDWIQLTPNSARCPTLAINYTRTVMTGVMTVVVDDDADPSNGIFYRSPPQTAVSGTVNVPTTRLFPGVYKVYGLLTSDYATSVLEPWDMDTSGGDVKTNRLVDIDSSTVSFASGKFCGTTNGTDPYFFLNVPDDRPIDASKFNRLSFDLTISGAMDVYAVFYDSANNPKGAARVPVNGSGRYNIHVGSEAGWSGTIHGLRLDIGDASGVPFCVDNVTLASSFLASIPSPTYTSPLTATIRERALATFVQPDKEGGLDYFVREKGNPSNMDSPSDIRFTSGLSAANVYPGNVYTDSAGFIRMGDYLEATSTTGNDDPVNGSVLSSPPINPDFYRLVCFDLDILKPVNEYRTVARVLWFWNDKPYDGDDLVIKTYGEKRYCLRLDTLPVEGITSGMAHPWQFNSDGTGIKYFRVDPHEESVATTYRVGDIRLASDHLANERYAFVISGSRDHAVDVYLGTSPRSTTGGVLIGTLTAGRSSQVLVWNSSTTAEGFYYPYVVVQGNTYYADAPVRVIRAFSDTTAPVLGIDAPQAGYRFAQQMQIAGHALDSTRVATVEVLVDGALAHSFRPNLFNKVVRDAYPQYPYASLAGFNQFVDLSSLASGDHTVIIRAYDTAGNMTEASSAVVKSSDNPTPDVTYPVWNEPALQVPLSGVISSNPGKFRISKATVSKKGEVAISLTGAGSGLCSVDLSLGKSSKKASATVGSYVPAAAKLNLSAKKLTIDKKAGKVFLFATRRCTSTQYNSVTTKPLTYGTTRGKLKSIPAIAAALKKNVRSNQLLSRK